MNPLTLLEITICSAILAVVCIYIIYVPKVNIKSYIYEDLAASLTSLNYNVSPKLACNITKAILPPNYKYAVYINGVLACGTPLNGTEFSTFVIYNGSIYIITVIVK